MTAPSASLPFVEGAANFRSPPFVTTTSISASDHGPGPFSRDVPVKYMWGLRNVRFALCSIFPGSQGRRGRLNEGRVPAAQASPWPSPPSRGRAREPAASPPDGRFRTYISLVILLRNRGLKRISRSFLSELSRLSEMSGERTTTVTAISRKDRGTFGAGVRPAHVDRRVPFPPPGKTWCLSVLIKQLK